MTTQGIEGVYLSTHNWGKAAAFFQRIGYTLEFETDHGSGQFRSETGPYLFVAEVPASEPVAMEAVLRVPDAAALDLDPAVEVVSPFEPTHWGTQRLVVRDPDGRNWNLEAPQA
jgi:hypothetical protein